MLVFSIALLICTTLNVSAALGGFTIEGPGTTSTLATDPSPLNLCDDVEFKMTYLKEIKSVPIIQLFAFDMTKRIFNSRDISVKPNVTAVMVRDDSWQLPAVSLTLGPNPSNDIYLPQNNTPEPGFESINYDTTKTGDFLAIRQKIMGNSIRIEVQTLFIDQDSYSVEENCLIYGHSFPPSSRGVVGAIPIKDNNNQEYIMVFCRNPGCEPTEGGRLGNGRLYIYKKSISSTSCQFNEQHSADLPDSANLADFSSIAVNKKEVAILSHTASAVWIGELKGVEMSDGRLTAANINEVGFRDDIGQILYVPRDQDCEPKFCSIRGIEFLSDRLLLAVSSMTDSSDEYTCLEKDESLHVFSLPPIVEIYNEPEL